RTRELLANGDRDFDRLRLDAPLDRLEIARDPLEHCRKPGERIGERALAFRARSRKPVAIATLLSLRERGLVLRSRSTRDRPGAAKIGVEQKLRGRRHSCCL